MVLKLIFEASHAPIYVDFIDGEYIGCYAAVENIPGDPRIPFRIEIDQLDEWIEYSHVDVIHLERENTPFAEGAYYERLIPKDTVLRFPEDGIGRYHWVRQIENGGFLLRTDGDRNSTGLSREKVVKRRERDPCLVRPIDESPFRVDDFPVGIND